MADALTAVDSILTGVKPELDASNNIVALFVNLALSYEAVDGTRIGRSVQMDVWDILDATQKSALQDIQQVILAHIQATYFA